MAEHILSKLSSLLPQEHAWKMHIFHSWPEIIGPLSSRVILYKISDDAVTLQVTHPGLAQELLMMSDLIRSKINTVLGRPLIKSIHFKSGAPVKSDKKPSSSRAAAAPQSPLPAPLSVNEQKHLETIEDKELRNALTAFYGTCKKRTTS